jgi:hypothetical protein
VHDALIELSRRHEGKDTKPVVKLLFDRGNPKQLIKNHQLVLPPQWKDLGIPLESEIKNIHLEVMVSSSEVASEGSDSRQEHV